MDRFTSHLLLLTATALSVGVVPQLGHAQFPVVNLAHGSCTPITLQNLGNPDQLDTTGFLRETLSERENFITFRPQVRALDFHVVCEVAGITRGTVAALSFVVDYECQDRPCTEDGRNSTFEREQIQYNCSSDFREGGGVDMVYEFFSRPRARTMNPIADFATMPATRCGLCVDPAASGLDSDPETHCLRKLTLKWG